MNICVFHVNIGPRAFTRELALNPVDTIALALSVCLFPQPLSFSLSRPMNEVAMTTGIEDISGLYNMDIPLTKTAPIITSSECKPDNAEASTVPSMTT